MSWMYGEGLSDRIRRVVSNFLAILPCDFLILLDLLFGILCDLSHRFRFPLVVHHLVLRCSSILRPIRPHTRRTYLTIKL